MLKQLRIDRENSVLPSSSELFTAYGAALSCSDSQTPVLLSDLFKKLSANQKIEKKRNCLQPLFADNKELRNWQNERKVIAISQKTPANEEHCFLGIDSGSTTAKIVVINKRGEILYQFYKNNNGNSLKTIIEGLKIFQHQLKKEGKTVSIQGTAVTGYGEDLIRTALNLVNLPPSDKTSENFGLTYANNEVCYPVTLVVGDIIKALKSNQYDPDEIAVGMTQTGGQCRATNYLSLIKRAMVNAGYGNIPVIALAPSDGLYNEQPGFAPDWKKFIRPAFFGLLFIDSLARMYYATGSRERHKSDSDNLRNKYINQAKQLIRDNNSRAFYSLLKNAIADVICMQPFGCIANHIIDKGIKKKIKEVYPELNLLFLDFDYGTSKVNLLNRLHFLIQNKEFSC